MRALHRRTLEIMPAGTGWVAMNSSAFKVSKTDAARRQLETAVRLWFFSQDPVSVHTLAAAAHQVLHDLGKVRGSPTILRSVPGIDPQYIPEIRKMVSSYENFFKHADKDSDALLNFNPDATEIFLLDAAILYENLTKEVVPVLAVFRMWMYIKNPNYMNEDARAKLDQHFKMHGMDFTKTTKSEFFKDYLEVGMRLGTA
jgi:hypothetical protein